ncbi:Asp-tRNA(Asn)/Glu-tRNA(Gln) amidotransferase subunit GatB [candidate division WS5 bacterium]|uniref:Aspartyl/glutamyl-tRNA(Asn/Gln) amidotransferase subunit B n=1 Tax=candidate division WS5 bacterium TaxID=2093353 RepID=A0A419DAG1_9BACT|nr:MAG: Asp-tRNA(Asn)/Glu-tRNA(Gln) amidotransferase subunit GatB [candidate division WS5 bacterium]
MQEYETTVGLEIHIQLKTKSKMFCPSDNHSVDAEPNTNVCPVCMGFPGTLPVPNRQAIEWTILLGLALGAEIPEEFNFERKNYFYPDLPKAYQISSATNPPVIGGSLRINIDSRLRGNDKEGSGNDKEGSGNGKEGVREKEIHLHHIHLEEDAGKLVHDKSDNALVDLNRAGTPLIEIVTEPEMSSAEEAKLFAQNLRSLVRHLGISDANMEQGNMRFDINVSVRKKGAKEMGTKVEVKNLNSFKMLEKAIQFEEQRQKELLEEGKKIAQETRGWDDNKGKTLPQRSKEEAQDYRYFPEPDIPPISTKEFVAKMKDQLPELPQEKAKRFEGEYGFDKRAAESLADDIELANYFEKTLEHIEKAALDSYDKKIYAKKLLSWMMELTAKIKESGIEFSEIKVEPENMAELIISIEKGTISGKQAKDVFAEMFETGKGAFGIIEEKGMKQITDTGEIESIIQEVLDANPKVVEEYKSGKVNVFGFFVGQVMLRTKGQANPKAVNEVLREKLK